MLADDLTAFLLARIDDDEATARAAGGRLELTDVDNPEAIIRGRGLEMGDHVVRWHPKRVLAECAAKRALIAGVRGDPFDAMGAESAYELLVLEALAQPYADHPHFHPSWPRGIADGAQGD